MLRGLARAPFGPRAPFGGGAGVGAPPSDPPTPTSTPAIEPPPSGPAATAATAPPAPPPSPPPPSHAPSHHGRGAEALREPDPAEAQFEKLKQHIHGRLVDRLDMNRVAEMDPKVLRNEIR